MKKTNFKIYIILAATLLVTTFACDPIHVSPFPGVNCIAFYEDVPIVGGGDYEYNSYRNNHYKIVVPNDNSLVSIAADFTGTEGRIYILNDAGEILTNSYLTDYATIENYEINFSGIYYVVITSDNPGTYTLDICGDITSSLPINADLFTFNAQSWNPAGGDYQKNSWRNQHFKIETTEDNTFIDIIAHSQGLNCRIYLTNSAGGALTNSYLDQHVLINAYKIENKGVCYVTICGEDDKSGTFDLSIVSKSGTLINVEKINSTNFNKHPGGWNPGGGIYNYESPLNDKYAFTVSNHCFVDIIAKSAGANCKLYLLNSAGNPVSGGISYTAIYADLVAVELVPGNYKVVVCADDGDSGTYDLYFYSKSGAVTDLTPQ